MQVLVRVRQVPRGRRSMLAMCMAAAFVLGGLLSATIAAAQGQVPEPVALISAYESARNRGDLDLAMSYFAADATLTQRSTVYSGLDEIRRYLQNTTGRGRFVVVSNRRVDGNQLAWTERPAGQNVNSIEVNVQAVVQDGKIQSLAYNGLVAQARADAAFDGRPQLPAVVGLGSVLAVLSASLLVASTGMAHSPGPQSRLRGRLLEGLQGWRSARSASG
jgi:hypothetical protein